MLKIQLQLFSGARRMGRRFGLLNRRPGDYASGGPERGYEANATGRGIPRRTHALKAIRMKGELR